MILRSKLNKPCESAKRCTEYISSVVVFVIKGVQILLSFAHILSQTKLVLKRNKILLSLVTIVMQTILATIFFFFFFYIYFLFDANKWIPVLKKLNKAQQGRRPNLCQLFSYAGPLLTIFEPSQKVLAILINQIH